MANRALTEQERLALVETLRQERQELDLNDLAAGHLQAGPSLDRPNVPVWDYEDYIQAHQGISIETLSNVRFPILFAGGAGSTVDSVQDALRNGRRITGKPTTFVSVVERWKFLNEEGVVDWDSDSRSVRLLVDLPAYKQALTRWSASQAAD